MKKIALAAAFLLMACAIDPLIVRKAAIRRAAGSKLYSCIKINPINREVCRSENYAYCLEMGLEKTCGIDDAWDLHFVLKRKGK